MIRRYFIALAAILPLAAPQAANAQAFERTATGLTDVFQTAVDLLPSDVTNIRLGIGPSISPDYEGSNDYDVNPLPVISLRYRNLIEVDNNEIKITAFNTSLGQGSNFGGGTLRFGPLISFNFGRGEGDNPALVGMGKVGTSLELGAFVSYALQDTRVRMRIRQDVAGGHRGGTIKFDLSQAIVRADKLALSAVVATTWATEAYLKSYFGVTGTQAAATGYPVYGTKAGFKDVFFGLNAIYIITDRWSLVSAGGYSRLIGSARNSPIVRQEGSPNQLSFSSFIIYSF